MKYSTQLIKYRYLLEAILRSSYFIKVYNSDYRCKNATLLPHHICNISIQLANNMLNYLYLMCPEICALQTTLNRMYVNLYITTCF